MKLNLVSALLCSSAIAAISASAAPLKETTAVHAKPDASVAPFTYLNAGTEPAPAPDSLANTPAGWMAVQVTGPFTGFVEKKDMTKALDVKAGVAIRTAPKADAPVLAIAAAGDKTSITGIQGRWTQIALDKPLTGYIRVGGTPGYLPPIATTPAGSGGTAGGSGPAIPPPAAYAPAATSQAGQAVQAAGDSSSTLPRQFSGKFVSTRSKLRPRRPYDWELVDNAGQRFAYLDVSKLLLTEQIDKYTGHFVVVFGAAKPTRDGRDIVITVESLQLQLR